MSERIGPYRVVGALERRGPFAVLRGEHEQLGHEAWIRTTAEHVVRRDDLDAAVLHEARVVAGLGPEVTPGVLEVLQAGDRAAVAYRAPEGPSLRAVLEARGRGASSLGDVAAAFAAMVRAVAAMHEAGVAHLALCPERMHVTRTGGVVVVDFLHARVGAEVPPPEGRLDPDPAALAYRAPEQIVGDPGDRASDVFALGLLGHELLTGRHPFGDDPAERARRVRHDEPPRLELDEGVRFGPSLGRDLEAILLRALAKPAALRPATAAELARELEGLGPEVALGDARGLLAAAGLPFGHAPRAAAAAPPPVVGTAAARLGVLGAAMVAVALLVGRGGDDVEVGARAARGGTPGRLVVLAKPWAEVHLDGKRLDVTPIGRPVEVRPGAHELVFRHPSAAEERRAVDVAPGQTVTVDVTMNVRRIYDAGVDASP